MKRLNHWVIKATSLGLIFFSISAIPACAKNSERVIMNTPNIPTSDEYSSALVKKYSPEIQELKKRDGLEWSEYETKELNVISPLTVKIQARQDAKKLLVDLTVSNTHNRPWFFTPLSPAMAGWSVSISDINSTAVWDTYRIPTHAGRPPSPKDNDFIELTAHENRTYNFSFDLNTLMEKRDARSNMDMLSRNYKLIEKREVFYFEIRFQNTQIPPSIEKYYEENFNKLLTVYILASPVKGQCERITNDIFKCKFFE
jgi:hypothetical protein